MIDRKLRLSPHFTLGELIPADCDHVPADVLVNLEILATELLEDVRNHFERPVRVHSGYRPPAKNAAVGGVKSSDHPAGRAADFHVAANADSTWEESTIAAFEYIRKELQGQYGQVILEDHRDHLNKPGKLWVHVSIPSPRHPGTSDPNSTLISLSPGHYSQALA